MTATKALDEDQSRSRKEIDRMPACGPAWIFAIWSWTILEASSEGREVRARFSICPATRSEAPPPSPLAPRPPLPPPGERGRKKEERRPPPPLLLSPPLPGVGEGAGG